MATNWRVLPISITVNNRQSFCFVTPTQIQISPGSAYTKESRENYVRQASICGLFCAYEWYTHQVSSQRNSRNGITYSYFIFISKKNVRYSHTFANLLTRGGRHQDSHISLYLTLDWIHIWVQYIVSLHASTLRISG